MAVWCWCEGLETSTISSVFDGKQSKIADQRNKREVHLHCHFFSSRNGSKEVNIKFSSDDFSYKMINSFNQFCNDLKSAGLASFKLNHHDVVTVNLINKDKVLYGIVFSSKDARIQFERDEDSLTKFLDTLEACIKWAEEE